MPGSRTSTDGLSLHVHEIAAVTWTSGVPSTGHLPGFDSTTSSGRVAQVHTESRRVATRSMPHFLRTPALSSMTSSSPAIGQTYESGGSFSAACRAACSLDSVGDERAIATSKAPSFIEAFPNYVTGRAKPNALMGTRQRDRKWRSPLGLRKRDRRAEALRHTLLAAALLVASAVALVAQAPTVEAAFAAWWASRNPAETQQRVDAIVKSRVGFDEAFRRLRKGRPYTSQPTGQVRLTNRTSDGIEHHFVLNIPDTYDPARAYQVRFHLHGGVMMRADNRIVGPGTVGALAGAEQIYIVPYSWNAAPWWSDDQLLNLADILDTAKRLYNIDENRVVVSGVSDGGTGAYYVAMRETTAFASFLPLNGYWMVLDSPSLNVDGPLYG